MRLSSYIIFAAVFVVAAGLSVLAGRTIATVVEDRSVTAVQDALLDWDLAWVNVVGDGLVIILEGEAPDEAIRFRARYVTETVVDATRVVDEMTVAAAAPFEAPDFNVEILSNESGVSLIGLVPAQFGVERLVTSVQGAVGATPITEFLDEADYDVPPGWGPAVDFAVAALAELPRSKISLSGTAVTVTAVGDSYEQKGAIEARLGRLAPVELDVSVEVSAPRPIISPYTLRFVIDGGRARFDACTADSVEAVETILQAARQAGAPAGPNACTLGLGAPSATWAEAVGLAIRALDDLGEGAVTFSGTDVSLVAAQGIDPDQFDRVVGELENGLPDIYALSSLLPVAAAADAGDDLGVGQQQFVAVLAEDGLVELRGRLSDGLSTTTVEAYAAALFGADQVLVATRLDPVLPDQWTARVLSSLDALDQLASGTVRVTAGMVEISGQTGNPAAQAEVARLLGERLGQAAEFSIDVLYVEALDPIASLPTPQECLDQILAFTAETKITFEPGSATIDASAIGVMDDIAGVLRECPDLQVVIAGYTDSQGRAEMNLGLSQRRADAVLTALRARRVPTSSFISVGYGAENPIADNDTEEGREANRRIEFTLATAEMAAAFAAEAIPMGEPIVAQADVPRTRPMARGAMEDAPDDEGAEDAPPTESGSDEGSDGAEGAEEADEVETPAGESAPDSDEETTDEQG